MIRFNKILCPTDFSEPSVEGLRYAIELARLFNAELCLVHVAPFTTPIPLDATLGAPFIGAHNAEALRQESARRLEEFAKQKLPPDLHISTRLGDGLPAAEIVRLAEAEAANLIVIATNGETGWRHLVFGSVAETVVRTANCPVLTVRAPRENNEQTTAIPVEQAA